MSADGKTTTLIKPDAVPALAGADAVHTGPLAVDSSGSLYAVVLVTRGETGKQYLVSFDSKGQYSSRLEIDPDEILVNRFEALGSGEFFVMGMRREVGPRAAVMASSGNAFRDIYVPEADQENTSTASSPKSKTQPQGMAPLRPAYLARVGKGQIYYVPEGQDSVYVIEPSGQNQFAFTLTPMPRTFRLVDLKAAGSRVVAMYYEEKPEHKAAFWMAVYDTTIGEMQTLYGPAPAVPVCYQNAAGADQFTLLDGATLVKMSP